MSSLPYNFGGLPEEFSSLEGAKVAILPIPYEGTVSYGEGTSQGPNAIIEASMNMELYDEELDQETCEIGIHTLHPVERAGNPEAMMQAIKKSALPAIRAGKFLVAFGGEHSVTKGVLDAFIEVRGKDFGVLQLDAHADLRESYDGSPHSHACIMKRVDDLGLPYAQVGIRSLSKEEADFVALKKRKIHFAHEIRHQAGWMDEVIDALPETLYITIDIDALDPSIMPSTGTPEPGGLDWYTTIDFLKKVAEKKRVIGFDVVELAPMEGAHAPDFLAAKLVYKLIGYSVKA